MNNENISAKEEFIKDLFSFFFNENGIEFFDDREISNVKTVIAERYYNDNEIVGEISQNEKLRLKYGSTRLVYNVLNDLMGGVSKENELIYFMEKLTVLNLFEDRHYDNNTLITSISVITEILKKTNDGYNNLKPEEEGRKSEYFAVFDILYKFSKKVLNKVKIPNQRAGVLTNFYNQVKRVFTAQRFKNADVFFKYYCLFLSEFKNLIVNIQDINNTINQFLNASYINADRIKSSIESVEIVQDFLKRSSFKEQILNRAKSDEAFVEAFYFEFSENDRMNLLLHWLQFDANRTIERFQNILKSIDYLVPKTDDFGNKIIDVVDVLRNDQHKESLFEIFFKLKFSKDYDYILYSNKIIAYICSSNIDLHKLGLNQLELHERHIDKHKLQVRCEDFLENTVIPNINQYHEHFKNILGIINKTKIDKKFINEKIHANNNFLQPFIQRLTVNHDLGLLKAIKPILSKSNYLWIAQAYFNTAGAHIRNNKNLIKSYGPIIKEFNAKYWSNLNAERKAFVENYRFNLTGEEDELISLIEK